MYSYIFNKEQRITNMYDSAYDMPHPPTQKHEMSWSSTVAMRCYDVGNGIWLPQGPLRGPHASVKTYKGRKT